MIYDNKQLLADNSTFFATFICQVKEFEKSLDSKHEAYMRLVSTSGAIMDADSVAYKHPNLVCFYGTIDNQPAMMLMHISQLNMTLISRPVEPDVPKRQIGFILDQNLD